MSFLLFGSSGWIGSQLKQLLETQGKIVHCSTARLENREHIQREIDTYKPKYIINCAGVTGRPNVDWCEDHKQETIRANVIGALNLCDIAYLYSIHVTYIGTGCIYEYDAEHPIGGKGFTEEDPPNFSGSFYSLAKGMTERLMLHYSNTLILRIRMPINHDLTSPRNFITKITKYERVVNVPNSVSVLEDLLPVTIDMTVKELKGVYNMVNPGAISHNEVLSLYKQYIDPAFTWQNFTLEEQSKILKAGRSNNTLDASKLLALYPHIKPIQESIHDVFKRAQEKLNERRNV